MADSGNVWAATIPADGAAVYAAPLGTTLPTSATAVLDNAFVDLGWVSEDGVTNSISRETTKHRAWGGEVVKVTQDNYTETVKLTLLESSADVLAVVYGADNVTENGDTIAVEHSRLMLEHQFTGEIYDVDFHYTNPLNYTDFAPPIIFNPPHFNYTYEDPGDADGELNNLVVQVNVTIFADGWYTVYGELWEGVWTNFITSTDNYTYLTEGNHSFEVRYERVRTTTSAWAEVVRVSLEWLDERFSKPPEPEPTL